MDNKRKEELLEIARNWMEDTLESWWQDITAWDGLIDDAVLTVEEWDWVTDNITIKNLEVEING